MKIVHVVYSLEMGGAEVLVGQLCRLQRNNGHEVTICAYARLGAVGERLRDEGFEIHVPGEAHPAKTMWSYYKLFRRMKPDVVHCHNPAPTLQAAMPARLAGAKSVISTRHSLVAKPYDKAAERKYSVMAYFCDWISGICEATCRNLRGALPMHRRKIVRVYNGSLPIRRLALEATDKRGFTLVFVGRLAAVKDLGTMIRAVAIAVKEMPELEFWVVGDGPVRKELEGLAESLGIAKNVLFWGQQMDTEGFFSAADAFVMSSTSEGLPMSLLQAMSIGIPAIVTDVGGMAEVVKLAQGGLLAPVGHFPGLAAAILKLAGDEGLWETFSANAQDCYEREFTLERMDAGYMELYQRRR